MNNSHLIILALRLKGLVQDIQYLRKNPHLGDQKGESCGSSKSKIQSQIV